MYGDINLEVWTWFPSNQLESTWLSFVEAYIWCSETIWNTFDCRNHWESMVLYFIKITCRFGHNHKDCWRECHSSFCYYSYSYCGLSPSVFVILSWLSVLRLSIPWKSGAMAGKRTRYLSQRILLSKGTLFWILSCPFLIFFLGMDIIWETEMPWQRKLLVGLSFGKMNFPNKFCMFYVFTRVLKLKNSFAAHNTMTFLMKLIRERI